MNSNESERTEDEPTELANGPKQDGGDTGLGRGGADEEAAETPVFDEEETRIANGPEQTEGNEGLGRSGA